MSENTRKAGQLNKDRVCMCGHATERCYLKALDRNERAGLQHMQQMETSTVKEK